MGRNFKILIIAVALLLALTVGVIWFTQQTKIANVESPDNYPTVSPTSALTSTPTPDQTVKTFKSTTLGVSFRYIASQGDPIVVVGNKIYVGGNTGQSVEEFTKDPQDSLTVAIQKKFLPGTLKDKCPVSSHMVSFVGDTTPANFETASINFNFTPTGLDDPRIASSPCPEQYRATNGVRYFLIDKNHPDRFFFFDIGQYAIFAEPFSGSGEPDKWQETFAVTNLGNRDDMVCAQVITRAKNPLTKEEKDFPTPCDVLSGWTKI